MKTNTKWVIDPLHSNVQFKIKHLVISTITGSFESFQGSLTTDSNDFSGADIEFSISVNSIHTNQENRDHHLKSEDFFDSEKCPAIIFRSSSFINNGNDEYALVGDLTIRDVTRKVTLSVEYGGTDIDLHGNTKAGFEITGKIDRKEFGLVLDGVTEAGTIVLGAEVRIDINLQFTKQNT